MRLVKLTGMPHPDYGNQSKPVYINSERITYIERSFSGWYKESAREAYQQALQQLREEVDRILAQVRKIGISVDTEQQSKVSINLRDEAAALSAAANLVGHYATQPMEHPRIECTTIGLSYADGSGTARVHVIESPEEVAKAINNTVAAWRS